MAALLNDQDLSQTATAAPAPVSTTTASGVGDSATTGGTTGTTGAAPQTVAPATPGSSQDVQQITNANQNADFSPLLNYVTGQGTAARTGIDTATNNFNTALGSWTPFGQTDQNTLQSVLAGSQPLSTGQALLNKTYSGPAGIDYNSYNPLIDTYTRDAGYTQNPQGINALLQLMNPALTPGERSYDATVYGSNPDYQTQSRSMLNDAGTVSGLGQTASTNATNAVNQRQSDIGAFNTAAQGYVTQQRDAINQAINNQIGQANTYDQGIQNEMSQLQSGAKGFGDYATSTYGFDPNQYAAQNFSVDPHAYPTYAAREPFTPPEAPYVNWGVASKYPDQLKAITDQYQQQVAQAKAAYDAAGGQPTGYAPGSFNQTVNPGANVYYNPGQAATRENVATKDQATQYNNAEQLLNLYDQLNMGAPRQAANLGINQQALAQALAQAQSQRDTVANQDAAWLAAQQKQQQQAAATAAYGGEGVNGSEGGGYDGGGDAAAAAAGGMDAGAAHDSGQTEAAAAAAGGFEGGGSGTNSNDSYAQGGLVGKAPRQRAKQTLNIKAPGAGPPPAAAPLPSNLMMTPPANNAMPATLAAPPVSMAKGGFVPPNAGPPGRDTVPARVNNGEFVLQRPAVNDVGVGNMQGLNQVDRMPMTKQTMVRNALHQALSRAAGG